MEFTFSFYLSAYIINTRQKERQFLTFLCDILIIYVKSDILQQIYQIARITQVQGQNMDRKYDTSANKFFDDNAVKIIPRVSSQSAYQLQSSRAHSQSERQFSTHRQSTQGTMRLNPKKFMHREVFNTKLYQDSAANTGGIPDKSMKKYFKISINKQQRQQSKLGDQAGILFSQASKILDNKNYHDNSEMKKLWKTIQHNVRILQKYTRFLDDSQPIKFSLKNTIQNLQQFLIKASNQLSKLQQYKAEQQLNITNLKRKKQIVEEQQLINLSAVSKIKQQINESNTVHKLKIQISMMDFEHKKLILKSEKLEEEVKVLKEEMRKMSEENKAMREEKEGIDKWKSEYEYKIKKLKEELEVAHIVKEQNLQEKCKYILNWQI